MRSEKGVSVIEIVLIVIAALVVAAVLLPVILPKPNCKGWGSYCQSNMKQIGNAVKMYLSDWNDTFPVNQNLAGKESIYVRLTTNPDGSLKLDKHGKPIRFQCGTNWVEALYPYVEAVTKSSDPQMIWRCSTMVDEKAYPKNSKSARVSYVFNRNLIAKEEGVVRCAANLLMIRESDRLVNSELRPTNNTTWTSKKTPISPFLTDQDSRFGKTTAKLHGNGSNILFADGHIKLFDISFFARKDKKGKLIQAVQWDPELKQWYNFVNNGPNPCRKSIAITP